jgi:hypothetical protein
MKVKGLGGKVRNREEWRQIVQEEKDHPELYGRGEGRRNMCCMQYLPSSRRKLQ